MFLKSGKILKRICVFLWNCAFLITSILVRLLSLSKFFASMEPMSDALKNTCLYNGKAYTMGIVIETAPGIMCECSSANDEKKHWIVVVGNIRKSTSNSEHS